MSTGWDTSTPATLKGVISGNTKLQIDSTGAVIPTGNLFVSVGNLIATNATNGIANATIANTSAGNSAAASFLATNNTGNTMATGVTSSTSTLGYGVDRGIMVSTGGTGITMDAIGAAKTITVMTNTTQRGQWTDTGLVVDKSLGVIATEANSQIAVNGVSTNATTTQRGVHVQLTGNSSSTSALTGFRALLTTAPSITTGTVSNFSSGTPTLGAGGTVTRFIGYNHAQSSVATNNASISDTTSFTGNWFINSTTADPSLLTGVLNLAKAGSGGSNVVVIDCDGVPATASSSNCIRLGYDDAGGGNFYGGGVAGGFDPNGSTFVSLQGWNANSAINMLKFNSAYVGIFQRSIATPGYTTSTATSGTISLGDNSPGLVINSVGGTTLIIRLPSNQSSVTDGELCTISSVGAFTTVTWQDAGGTAGNVIGGQVALGGVNRGQSFIYSSALTKWLSI